jgi:hypothetical protein
MLFAPVGLEILLVQILLLDVTLLFFGQVTVFVSFHLLLLTIDQPILVCWEDGCGIYFSCTQN